MTISHLLGKPVKAFVKVTALNQIPRSEWKAAGRPEPDGNGAAEGDPFGDDKGVEVKPAPAKPAPAKPAPAKPAPADPFGDADRLGEGPSDDPFGGD